MSTTIYCDLCEQVIKPNSKKYVFAVTDIIQDDGNLKIQTVSELQEELQKQRSKVETYEMCPGCYKVLRHLFKMRKDKLEEIKNEINKIFKTRYPKKRKYRRRKKS